MESPSTFCRDVEVLLLGGKIRHTVFQFLLNFLIYVHRLEYRRCVVRMGGTRTEENLLEG